MRAGTAITVLAALAAATWGCGDDGGNLTAGSCVTPGERRCDGDDVQLCGEGGLWVVEERCATRCEAGACSAPVCSPGATRCDGPEVQQCNARGTGWEFRQACATACIDGACATPVCSPFSRRCNGADVEECDERGLAWRRVETCPVACEAAACVTLVPCTEGEHRCNSRLLEVCSGGVWSFEELCDDTTCLDGVCAECLPGQTRCSASEVERCRPDGTGWEGVETCTTTCVGGACGECVPGERRCTDRTVEVCAADGSGWVPVAYCATACTAGACRPPECAPGAVRCNAGAAEVCDAGGLWVETAECEIGCLYGRCTVCTPGTTRCNGSAVEACASDGSGWSFVQHCATGCAGGECNPLTCAPLSRRCNGRDIEVCNPTGTGWTSLESCSTGCRDGFCTGGGGGGVCVPGAYRCVGNDVEACDTAGGAWFYVQTCLGSCAAGVCTGGACTPFSVTLSPASVRADGQSSLLARTEPIVDVGGTPLPDGTLVRVEAEIGTVSAADADPATTAVEVALHRGRADAAITAPAAAGAGSGRIRFVLPSASACTGSASVAFTTAASGAAARGVDLTATALRDAATDSAFWDTPLGRATAATTTFGFGQDGDLTVSGTYTLTSNARPGRSQPDAVGYAVSAIGADSVTAASTPSGIDSGDDVLLINLQGTASASAAVGRYEVLTVSRVAGTRIEFVTPVRRIYGQTTNADLTGQRILVQRVPRYRNVTVNGTLTAGSWNGTTGGVLFFKASGTVTVNTGGRIDMTGRGYRGASSGTYYGESTTGTSSSGSSNNTGGGGGANSGCNCCYGGTGGGYGTAGTRASCSNAGTAGAVYGDAPLTGWFLGSGGGGTYYCCCGCSSYNGENGGGLLVVFAPTIAVAGTITNSGNGGFGGGSGGTIYLLGNTVTMGTALVRAEGGTSSYSSPGGVGRIRVDGATVTGTTTPAFHAGTVAAGVAATLRTGALDAAAGTVRTARILAVESHLPGASLLRYFLSNDGGGEWTEAAVDTAVTFTGAGSDLRFRADWEGVGSAGAPTLAGFAVEYTAD